MDDMVITLMTNALEDTINFIIFSSLNYLVIWGVMKFKYFKPSPKFRVHPENLFSMIPSDKENKYR